MAPLVVRRASPIALCLLLPACGLIIGLDDVGVEAGKDEVVTPIDANVGVADSGFEEDGAPGQIPPPVRPPAGTYEYTITGGDRIEGVFDFPATYGPTATVTISHIGADCFDLRLTLRANYNDTMRLCIKGLELVQEAGTRSQTFAAGASATTTTTCKPGDVYLASAPTVGFQWKHDCTGSNSDDKSGGSAFSTRGFYRYEGRTTVPIQGTDVPVMHFYHDRVVTGSQTGTNVANWYISKETGLVVRLTRNINVAYNAPIVGKVDYIETVDMSLKAPPGVSDAGTD